MNDRKQQEFERREEAILDAALELFSQPSWESVSIEKIAQQAQVGKGTVYKHFVSKDELLFRLMLRFYKGLLNQLKITPNNFEDFLGGFQETLAIALNYHIDHSQYRYVVEYCKRIDFKQRAEKSWRNSFLALDKAFGDLNEKNILAAMDAGEIAKRPLEEIHLGLHACFDGAVNMLWSREDWCSYGDDKDVITNISNFMISGLIGPRAQI